MNPELTPSINPSFQSPIHFVDEEKKRKQSLSDQVGILADIYQQEINMVVWRRRLPADMTSPLGPFMVANPGFQIAMPVTPVNARTDLQQALKGSDCAESLSEDAAELVDMFCCLFDLQAVGLRLTVLSRAMCPRFHTDRVPCRLVTTYTGIATEWLPHDVVDRTKLGAGNRGLADDLSGLYQDPNDIQQLTSGDVALMKGELWEGNENAGLVHRSPQIELEQPRLLLTLDFAS